MNDLTKAKDAYAKAVELEPSNDSYQANLRIAEKKLKDANIGVSRRGKSTSLPYQALFSSYFGLISDLLYLGKIVFPSRELD